MVRVMDNGQGYGIMVGLWIMVRVMDNGQGYG